MVKGISLQFDKILQTLRKQSQNATNKRLQTSLKAQDGRFRSRQVVIPVLYSSTHQQTAATAAAAAAAAAAAWFENISWQTVNLAD